MGEGEKLKLGKILIKRKLVSPEQLDQLLTEQGIDDKRLASLVLEKKLADEVQLLEALSEQHGVPSINLDFVEISLKNIETVPYDIARRTLILPIATTPESVHLAMADPGDQRVRDEIGFVTGRRIFPHVALQAQMEEVIEACYSAHGAGEKIYRGKLASTRKTGGEQDQTEQAASGVEVEVEGSSDALDDEITIEIDIEEPEAEIADDSAESPSGVEPGATPEVKGAKRILVVDDEQDILTLISRVLTEKGYEVITALRGFEAVQKIQSEPLDMIILDAMLPEVHGFDICKKIKGSAKYSHIPVIMISAIYKGWRYAKDLKESYGANEFIEKPFKIRDLIELVERQSRTSSTDLRPSRDDLSKEAKKALAGCMAAYRAGKMDEAIELLNRGLKIDPLAFKLRYQLGLILAKRGLSYQAIHELENALDLEPDNFSALKNLAVLYQNTSFKLKAIETWERALEHSPNEKTRDEIKQRMLNLL